MATAMQPVIHDLKFKRNRLRVYRYFVLADNLDPRAMPLNHCPVCEANMEDPASITILLDDESEVATRLESGVLQDTEDIKAAKGHMEDVCCSKCATSLQEHPDVDEEELRF